jgi:rhamnogalacturonan endolyase
LTSDQGSDLITLLEDEFDQLRTGRFSALVGAHTEYHYLAEAAPQGNWNVASFASGIGAGTAWHVRETEDGKDLVQTFASKRTDTHPMVIAGASEWEAYKIEVRFTPHANRGRTGIVFRYRNSRCYYFFGLTETDAQIIKVNHGTGYREVAEDILATGSCAWEPGTAFTASVTVNGSIIGADIAGLVSLKAEDKTFTQGKIGLQSDSPANFHAVTVSALEEEKQRVNILHSKSIRELDDLREQNPKPVLWKKISTEGFGVGRNLRFGDLTGTENPTS